MEKSIFIVLVTLVMYVQAGIKILHPRDLKQQFGNEGQVKASLGNFGHI